jgi:hypothetical protein
VRGYEGEPPDAGDEDADQRADPRDGRGRERPLFIELEAQEPFEHEHEGEGEQRLVNGYPTWPT